MRARGRPTPTCAPSSSAWPPVFGQLEIVEAVGASMQPRWIYHSMDAMRRLKTLHAALGRQMGASFVAGAWEPYAKGEKFQIVSAGLAAALNAEAGGAVAAA